VALLESKEVSKSMKLTTRDFMVQPGRLNHGAVVGRLYSFFRNSGRIAILHPSPDVEVHESGESALVSMPFVVAKNGTRVEALDNLYDDPEAWAEKASEHTTVQRAELSMVKENDRWLIRTIRF
jgi:hypothetical protein